MSPLLWTRLRWCLWGAYVTAWTTALLVPVPPQTHIDVSDMHVDVNFLFAKTVHLSAYALFAALTAWLRAPMRLRFVLMFFLMVHATVTEVLQYELVSFGRTGSLFDVALDHVGIAVGSLLAWKWWTQPDAALVDRPAMLPAMRTGSQNVNRAL